MYVPPFPPPGHRRLERDGGLIGGCEVVVDCVLQRAWAAAVESIFGVVLYVPGVLLGVVEAGEGGGAAGEGGYVSDSFSFSFFFFVYMCFCGGEGKVG